jgi:hypothetical protein
MGPQVSVGGHLVGARGGPFERALEIAERAGVELGHPRVVAVGHPFVVGQQGEPVRAPLGPPRVVHPEAVGVVADDDEGVAALLGVVGPSFDPRRGVGEEQAVPPDVDAGRGEQRVALGERPAHPVDVGVHDPAVADERPVAGVEEPGEGERAVLLAVFVVGVVRPQIVEGDAGASPPAQGAAHRRAFVEVLVVVELGALVEHAPADRRECGVVVVARIR